MSNRRFAIGTGQCGNGGAHPSGPGHGAAVLLLGGVASPWGIMGDPLLVLGEDALLWGEGSILGGRVTGGNGIFLKTGKDKELIPEEECA